MNLRIQSHEKEGVLVLTLAGRLTMDSEGLLFERVKKATDGGVRRLLVDLSGIEYVDSHGLGQMVACHNALHSEGGRVRFVGVNERLRRLLEMTHLPKVLGIDSDITTGLAQLGHL